jgi:hypothetical protein
MKFRNFIQGDLSIIDYCRRLKKMVDDLMALGATVTDCTLVLSMICGLNECFSHVGALLHRAQPFTSFLEARDDLILEELTLENQKDAPTTVLAASTMLTSPNPVPPSSGMGSEGVGGPKSSNSRRSKRGGGGKGGSAGGQGLQSPTSSQQHASSTQQLAGAAQPATANWYWPTVYNP